MVGSGRVLRGFGAQQLQQSRTTCRIAGEVRVGLRTAARIVKPRLVGRSDQPGSEFAAKKEWIRAENGRQRNL